MSRFWSEMRFQNPPWFGLLPYTEDSRFFEPPWENKICSRLEKTRVKLQLLTCERKFDRLARIRSPETGNKRMNVESGGGHFRNFEYLSLAREFLTTSSLTGGGNLRLELIKLYRSM